MFIFFCSLDIFFSWHVIFYFWKIQRILLMYFCQQNIFMFDFLFVYKAFHVCWQVFLLIINMCVFIKKPDKRKVWLFNPYSFWMQLKKCDFSDFPVFCFCFAMFIYNIFEMFNFTFIYDYSNDLFLFTSFYQLKGFSKFGIDVYLNIGCKWGDWV